MTDENRFDVEFMTDEELADYHLKEAIEHAETTLRLARNCELKFGKRLLTPAQETILQKIADGEMPTDAEMETLQNEEISGLMKSIRLERETNRHRAAELGEAYEPELVFQDKTEGKIN